MKVAEARFLIAYNQWANWRILQAVEALDLAQLRRDLGSSYGSVWDTLAHMGWGEWLWLGRWRRGRGETGPDPQECGDLAALRARWAEIERGQAGFVDGLTDADLAAPISYQNPPGTTWTYALGEMVRHVVNHSTYHRGQVTTLLRQLGVAPPATDTLVFLDETKPTRS